MCHGTSGASRPSCAEPARRRRRDRDRRGWPAFRPRRRTGPRARGRARRSARRPRRRGRQSQPAALSPNVTGSACWSSVRPARSRLRCRSTSPAHASAAADRSATTTSSARRGDEHHRGVDHVLARRALVQVSRCASRAAAGAARAAAPGRACPARRCARPSSARSSSSAPARRRRPARRPPRPGRAPARRAPRSSATSNSTIASTNARSLTGRGRPRRARTGRRTGSRRSRRRRSTPSGSASPREESGRGRGGGLVACERVRERRHRRPHHLDRLGGRSPSMSASIRSTERSHRARTSSPLGVTDARSTRRCLGSGRRRTSRRRSSPEITRFIACGVTSAQRASCAQDRPSRSRSRLSVTYSGVETP